MAPKRRASPTANARSSEIGIGDSAAEHTPNSRVLRTRRSHQVKPAQEDGEDHFSEDDYDDDMSDEIAVAHSRKMKRTTKKTKATRSAPSLSPTRELPDINDLEDAGLTSDDESIESHVPAQGLQLDNHVTVHLTINIPLNHKGPITLNLDPKACMPAPSDRLSQIALARINARSKSSKSKSVGFLDLPAELKNVIYREIFVSDSPLSFGRPTSFSRTSALLRTCKQVYEEGRSILYSENSFIVESRMDKSGSLWSNDWRETGYLAARKFMKSIGLVNTALIRHITFILEDTGLLRFQRPERQEEMRFINNEELIAVLRHLAHHSQLQTMKLHFAARRRVRLGDDRFLDHMRRVRADKVEFVRIPREVPQGIQSLESRQQDGVEESLLLACTRKHKKFD